MLQADNISYIIKERVLFANISFKLNNGTSFYIYGANGSGKTTLLKILAGFIEPTFGKVHLNSLPKFYMGHDMPFIENLSVQENILLFKKLYSIKKNFLPENSKLLFSQLSYGQKKKLLLSCFNLASDGIYLLDEPFNGLDKNGINILKNIMDNRKKSIFIISSTKNKNEDGIELS